MKRAPASAKVLLRCLNARQFGLKLIANVTYGYTAAGFSGGCLELVLAGGGSWLQLAARMGKQFMWGA